MVMGSRTHCWHPVRTALIACFGLVLAACGGGVGSRASTGAAPLPAPTEVTTTTSTPSVTAGTATSGSAYGYVTAGPTCPVERPDQPCPPRPVAAHVQAQDSSGRSVATTDSDNSGSYQLLLPPGTYTLTAVTGSTYPRCQPVSVAVKVGSPIRADITCDTGIR
jgi:hypothetical protein